MTDQYQNHARQIIIEAMTDKQVKNTSEHTAHVRLQRWFESTPGSLIRERECRSLGAILPGLFGYHFVQIGQLFSDTLRESTRIGHRVLVQLEEEGLCQPHANLCCPSDALPFSSDSIDVVVLPHVLEYSTNPHKLLREIERVLIGEGHLVITGFNPWSLFGLWRLALAWRDDPPWSGHFFSYARIKDWFSLLDLEVVSIERSFYRPPISSGRMLERLSFLEKLGNYCWSLFGAVHIIVVRKRVVPLTPIRMNWHKRRRLIEAGLAEPTARSEG